MGLIGIEWVQEYNGRWEDPANTRQNAEGFYNTLLNATKNFAHGNNAAQDKHFEQKGAGFPTAGTATTHVEKVDMVYFAGHGTWLGPQFGVLQDDAVAKPAEIRWGNGRLKWVVLNACDVLLDNSVTHAIDRWGSAFAGLRYILGFASATSDEPHRGQIFAQYVNAGNTIRDAWVKACQDTEKSSTVWAYMRADGNGVTTDQDTWIAQASATTKPNPADQVYYVNGAC